MTKDVRDILLDVVIYSFFVLSGLLYIVWLMTNNIIVGALMASCVIVFVGMLIVNRRKNGR